MKKQKFLYRRKLVKATTITMALLIAATLISSSAVSVTLGSNSTQNKLNSTTHQVMDADPNIKASTSLSSAAQAPPQPLAMWDLQFSFDVAAASGAAGNTGVEWDGDYFYSCRWGSALMHQYSDTGVMLKEFSVAGVTGSRDFAYNDGNGYMYSGAAATTMWEYDVISETLINSYTMPGSVRALAYDDDEDAFWFNNWGNDIVCADTSGTILYTVTNTISLYSLAFDNQCGDPTLWLFSGTTSGGGCQIEQYVDIYTGGTLGPESHIVGGPATYIAGGLGYTDSFFPGETTLMALGQGDGNADTIFCYEICETGPGAGHDVGVKSINAPSSGPAGVITPEVTIQNYGNNSETTDVQLTISTGLPSTSLYSVDFTPGPGIPGDWTIIDGGTSNDTWFYGTFYGQYIPTATCDSDGAGSGVTMDEELISPIIDCSAATTVTLEYDHYFDGGGGSYTNQGDTYVWDGANWILIANYPIGTYTSGVETYDVTAYAAGNGDFRVKYHFNDSGFWGYGWSIFDMEVFIPGSLVNEYDQTVTGVTVPIGGTEDVVFPDWTPIDWQVSENVDITYDVQATTLLADDNPANDQKDKAVTLNYPYMHDIEVVSVDSPINDGPAQTLPVEVTIKNVGQFSECCYKTNVQIGKLLGSFLNEDFSGGVPPSGWTTTHPSNWGSSATSNAGGTSPEARFSWTPSAVSTFRLYTGAMDTTGITNIDLSFKHYVNDYNGMYNLGVETSTDGVTWNTVWYVPGGPMGPETITIPLTAADGLGSSTFYVSWTFFGDSFNINYWYIDDALMQDVSVITEYDEDICTILLDPGEEAQLIFPDWTPDDLALGISGTLNYGVVAEQQLPGDTNPANDVAANTFELDYWHDVGVKEITDPSDGRGSQEWIHYDDGTNVDAIGLTAGGSFEWGIRLTPTELGTYGGYDLTKMRFHHGYTGGTPGSHSGNVYVYEQGTSTSPGTLLSTTPWTDSGIGWVELDLDTAVPINPSEDLWLTLDVTHVAGEYPAGVGAGPMVPGKGGWIYLAPGPWQEIGPLGLDYNWNLWAGLVPGGGPPTPDIFVAPGTQSFAATIENIGTFGETGLDANAKLFAYTPNATLIYEANYTDFDLDPLGGEEAATFGSYAFSGNGVYQLKIVVPLGTDDFPNNNEETLGIGVDDTAPNSQHTVTPATPNGENGWYTSPVTVDFTADDGTEVWQSGVDRIEYRVNGAGVQTGNSVTLSTDGDHDVEYRAVDNVGNVEGWNSVTTIRIDQTVPTVVLTWESPDNKNVIFTATCSDATSGMDYVEFYLNDGWMFTAPAAPFEYTIMWSPTLKTAVFTAKAFDKAGNFDTDDVTDIVPIPVPHGQTTPTPVVRQTNPL